MEICSARILPMRAASHAPNLEIEIGLTRWTWKIEIRNDSLRILDFMSKESRYDPVAKILVARHGISADVSRL
jgi:hypothetical protein